MKSPKSEFVYHPFGRIKDLLEAKSFSLPDACPTDAPCTEEPMTPEEGKRLFMKAMEGVARLPRDPHIERNVEVPIPEASRRREDAEVLLKLKDLVEHGVGFNIFDTPEYVEGTGYNVHPEIARRLHRGEYSIQASVDLHGLVAEDAKEVFEKFMKWAMTTGKTGLLVIHGRGLSSPSEPVLKKKVQEWLTRGVWRKWVVAYASARLCDGGAGATYVLIRRRPVSKRQKTRSKRKRPAL